MFKIRVESRSVSGSCHFITLSLTPVENSPEADVRPWRLPHITVDRAAWSPDRCCTGAQLGHWGSAVAQTRSEVPQGVPVGGQRRTTRHPGSTKWVWFSGRPCSCVGRVCTKIISLLQWLPVQLLPVAHLLRHALSQPPFLWYPQLFLSYKGTIAP